jgi:hypothetical protein
LRVGKGCHAIWLGGPTERPRIMALMYAAIFFMAAFVPEMISDRRAMLFSHAANDAIVLACLAKDPADRPQRARDLARRLEAVRVTDEWTPERALAWWLMNQPVPSAAAAVAAR